MMKTYTLAFHDRQHIQRILMQQNAVGLAFNQFIANVSPHLRKWTDRGGDSVWVRNSSVEKAIDKALLILQASLQQNITEFQTDAWKGANIKNDDMVSRFIDGMAISSLRRDGMFRQNMEAFRGLQKEVDANGLNVSQKVWKITDQAKTNLEFYLDSGISSGRSASGISSDIRQILDKPDKRFRRIRDENGKLQLSKPMEEYHPGSGVYRSSRMNALRLAATTTNVAYRKADYERWQNLDFVLGIEISRSPSNKGPCKICDAMVGKYPKGFQFLGFHPFCICIATPILQKPEDFADFLLDDEIPKEQLVTDIPADARKFMLDNEYMQKSYAFRDNVEWFTNSKVEEPVTKYTDDKTKKLYEAIEKTENEIRMNKKFETGVAYNKNGDVIIDKRGAAYSVEFTKEECQKMKDCIFTHNHPRGWGYPENSLGRIGNSFSTADISFAVRNDLSEMRAVTPIYTFIMKRPEAGWGDYDKVMAVINKENEKLRKEFGKRIDEGTLTINQANATHFHILWKRVSEKLGWMYSKAKTG